jgi:hypothetical protein
MHRLDFSLAKVADRGVADRRVVDERVANGSVAMGMYFANKTIERNRDLHLGP